MKKLDLPEGYIGVTMHKFKTHLNRYIDLLNDRRAKAVVVLRYDKPQAVLYPLNKTKKKTSSKI